jgi:AcrR family transcriptional regulator
MTGPADPLGDLHSTAARIFLAAERQFAELGFDGVSVRDIVQEAEVNLAAVSYHYGSKGELLLAVFRARTKEMNRERHVLLREAEAAHAGAPPLPAILLALLGPPILWRDPASGKETASRFIARAIAEATPDLESDVRHLTGFLAPLARALPGWSEAEVCWALHFAIGVSHQCTDMNFRRLKALSDGRCDTEDVGAVLARAVRFAEGGIEALQPDMSASARRASRS